MRSGCVDAFSAFVGAWRGSGEFRDRSIIFFYVDSFREVNVALGSANGFDLNEEFRLQVQVFEQDGFLHPFLEDCVPQAVGC